MTFILLLIPQTQVTFDSPTLVDWNDYNYTHVKQASEIPLATTATEVRLNWPPSIITPKQGVRLNWPPSIITPKQGVRLNWTPSVITLKQGTRLN